MLRRDRHRRVAPSTSLFAMTSMLMMLHRKPLLFFLRRTLQLPRYDRRPRAPNTRVERILLPQAGRRRRQHTCIIDVAPVVEERRTGADAVTLRLPKRLHTTRACRRWPHASARTRWRITRDRYGDVVCERADVVHCGGKVLGGLFLAVDDEADVVCAGRERDCCSMCLRFRAAGGGRGRVGAGRGEEEVDGEDVHEEGCEASEGQEVSWVGCDSTRMVLWELAGRVEHRGEKRQYSSGGHKT